MSAFEEVTQFAKMLKSLDRFIGVALAHAEKKKFDPESYFTARLAIDQYPFFKQIQAASDAAKFAAAYLSGQKAPVHPDDEKTVADLRKRLDTCITYLGSFKASDFEGANERHVAPAWLQGRWAFGEDYFREIATPNFYFHVTTAYAILRNAGVDLGKRDFIGELTLHDG